MNFLNQKIIIIGAIVLGLAALVVWAFFESSKPLPGQTIDQLGRDHVNLGTEVIYNSNPPTSGHHYPDWKRPGVYEQPQDDRYLVHSLEHGYVIISYHCDSVISLIPEALAHESTDSAQATTSASLGPEFLSDECKKLVEQLKSVYEKKGQSRLIVVPRPNLDSKIALTAWGRIEKLDNFDQNRIEKFIDAYRNKGPEQTME